MPEIQYNLYPNGRHKALTMSYDDGNLDDIRLVGIFNKYGLKGTFHLNSGNFGKENYVGAAQAGELYAGHEISVHGKTHPFLDRIPADAVIEEIYEDKKALENAAGYPVRGMSYPYGAYTKELLPILRSLGMEYSRTVNATNNFEIPADFLEWHPTTHHNGDLDGLWERYQGLKPQKKLTVLYIWGHSFEFPRNDNWNVIEEFCKKAGGQEDIWYASNIEIVDYVNAVKSLRVSADHTMIQNISGIDVWISVDGEPACIKSGSIFRV